MQQIEINTCKWKDRYVPYITTCTLEKVRSMCVSRIIDKINSYDVMH